MKIRRIPKALRDKIDAMLLGEIAEGRGKHDYLVERVYHMLIKNCGTIENFILMVASYYVTTRKQSLHQQGKLDLGANGVAKLPEDMNDNDRHAAVSRRNKHLVGDLVGAAREFHYYQSFEMRDMVIRSLTSLDLDAAVRVKEELGI